MIAVPQFDRKQIVKSELQEDDGVRADAGVSEWAVLGCRIGNFGSAQSQRSAYGVNLSGSTSNVRIQGNDLRSYGPGKTGIKNTATGGGISIANNL